MERLTGTIRLLPLIIGNVEIGSFTMVRPLIRLIRDNGEKNWAFNSGAAALQLAFAGDVPLGDFLLEDGTVVYENREVGLTERLDSVNLTLQWSSVRQPLAVSGSGIWRGEQVAFSASAAAPFAFLNGDLTPVEARLDSAPIAVVFSGEGADIHNPRLTGSLSMSTPSLRGFAAWLGSPIGPGSTLGQASLAGAAIFREGVLSVENAQLTLDGNAATGALEVGAAAKPDVAGTLAFPSIDLTTYFAGISDVLGAGGNWREVAIAADWLGDFSADIRLSAGSVQIGDLRFGDTAASISLRDARLEVGVAQAAFSGGSVAGDLAITDSAALPEATVEAKLRATDINLAQAAPALGLPPRLSGAAAVSVDVSGRGGTLGSLLRDLGGTAKLDLENGAFPLFGMAEIGVGGAGANPQQLGVAAVTPVKSVSAGFSLSGGVAILERASVAALSFTADAKGWIGLLDGGLGLNGTVMPGAPGLPDGVAVPFTIGGTLAQPEARPLALAN